MTPDAAWMFAVAGKRHAAAGSKARKIAAMGMPGMGGRSTGKPGGDDQGLGTHPGLPTNETGIVTFSDYRRHQPFFGAAVMASSLPIRTGRITGPDSGSWAAGSATGSGIGSALGAAAAAFDGAA